jgi:triacylglycerol lipase
VLPHLGRRCVIAGLTGLLLLSQPVPAAAAPAPQPGNGPAMITSFHPRADSLRCSGDLDAAARAPVLLVPGTTLTPMENWAPTYLPVLLDRGHAVCLVRLPRYGTRDVQANVEYVASAIRAMAQRSRRKISTIGHSQGALLPTAALRTWPDLAAHVDDVIGIAGVYDRGSTDLRRRCQPRCLPVLHQLAPGSDYLTYLAQRPLPRQPSYSNIGTIGDQTVTPQPAANKQPGAASLIVQKVCPGHLVPEPQHAMIAGDGVALSLALDALDHPGVASAARIDRATCAQQEYPEFDAEAFLSVDPARASQLADPVAAEPQLYCRHRADCRNPRLRGHMVARPHYAFGPSRVRVRMMILQPGWVRVVVGRGALAFRASPGPVTLNLPRPVGPTRLRIQTRPRHYTAWGAEWPAT